MDGEPDEIPEITPPGRYRGPQGLGETVARALGECAETSESVGAMEEESFLKRWFADHGGYFPGEKWESYRLISADTSEHEVRFRESDYRAVKRTWPGTFGNIPREISGRWVPAPATPSEYLHRLTLRLAK